MDLEQLLQQLRQVEEGIRVESSLVVPEGLMIVCEDGEHARRMRVWLELVLPEKARELIDVTDRRVLLRYPKYLRYLVDQPKS